MKTSGVGSGHSSKNRELKVNISIDPELLRTVQQKAHQAIETGTTYLEAGTKKTVDIGTDLSLQSTGPVKPLLQPAAAHLVHNMVDPEIEDSSQKITEDIKDLTDTSLEQPSVQTSIKLLNKLKP